MTAWIQFTIGYFIFCAGTAVLLYALAVIVRIAQGIKEEPDGLDHGDRL